MKNTAGQNTEFTTAALEFPQIVVFAAECLRITPKLLRPLVAALVTRRHRAARTLFKYLEPIVQQRLMLRAQNEEIKDKPVDCMQWLIDTSPRQQQWSVARMIGEIIAIWFSSVHQLAMELLEHKATKNGSVDVEELPLLDSFLKESIRYSNADAISCRRKALQDYTLQDGPRIEKGDWVCIPQRAMMQDPLRYSHPTTFDGFRFARANVSLQQGSHTTDVPDKAGSKLTEASIYWPIWGLGKTACPGRFYASLVLKLIVTQILSEWECDIPDRTSPRSIFTADFHPTADDSDPATGSVPFENANLQDDRPLILRKYTTVSSGLRMCAMGVEITHIPNQHDDKVLY
ncbi:hypothetical protein E0Z10_g10499 [Xylaria hypoxylon]|uniref:Cytochrome P450 n=1 Tax=Xylaria hypoxylon TaxID=37992 RepID=A0A4Z0Y2V9_9PEZI|nr:hypothetical protein E0Z10_g10499 [Xylaria hypoxylon]